MLRESFPENLAQALRVVQHGNKVAFCRVDTGVSLDRGTTAMANVVNRKRSGRGVLPFLFSVSSSSAPSTTITSSGRTVWRERLSNSCATSPERRKVGVTTEIRGLQILIPDREASDKRTSETRFAEQPSSESPNIFLKKASAHFAFLPGL